MNIRAYPDSRASLFQFGVSVWWCLCLGMEAEDWQWKFLVKAAPEIGLCDPDPSLTNVLVLGWFMLEQSASACHLSEFPFFILCWKCFSKRFGGRIRESRISCRGQFYVEVLQGLCAASFFSWGNLGRSFSILEAVWVCNHWSAVLAYSRASLRTEMRCMASLCTEHAPECLLDSAVI